MERMDDQVPYGQKGVDGGNKWKTSTIRETEVRLD